MLYNFDPVNCKIFSSCDPTLRCCADSPEMEKIASCMAAETVVFAKPQGWIWDPVLGEGHPSALLAEAAVPGCEAPFPCVVAWEELDRGGFRTPDHILFQGIRVVLSLNERGELMGSRKRAQEITAAVMAGQDRADEVYEAVIVCRRPDGYTVLVNDHHAHLRDCDIYRPDGRAALLRQQGQTMKVRFSHVFPNGHMFVYSDEKYPRVEDVEFGTYLPCRVLELRENHILTALTPRTTAVAYYPDFGTVKAGDVVAGRVTRKVRNEDGSLYIRVKLFPGAAI